MMTTTIYNSAQDLERIFPGSGETAVRNPAFVETAVYRFAQEALINIRKQAQAESVSLIVEQHRNEILVIIEGKGVQSRTECPP